jgi:hypothetical protein
MALSNFLIIGVAKAGTTSLYHYLGQHPDIATSRTREPNYLIYYGHLMDPIIGPLPKFRVRTIEEYEALYSGKENRRARGDISPTYIVYPKQTIAGIRKYVPEAKIIVIYRQPADRGYSNYLMYVRKGTEPLLSYAEALAAETAGRPRIGGRQRTYFNRGFYREHTEKFLQAFPRERFLFLLYDDLIRDPTGLLRSIFLFLDVDAAFAPDTSKRHNAALWPRNLLAHRVVTSTNPIKKNLMRLIPDVPRKAIWDWIYSFSFRQPPKLDPELRRDLTLRYRDDIRGLQDLIGRDLSGWLE